MADALFSGKKFRALALVDNHTRECLAIEVGPSLTGNDVVRVLARVTHKSRGGPARLQADNDHEFVSLALDKWACDHQLEAGLQSFLTAYSTCRYPASAVCQAVSVT